MGFNIKGKWCIERVADDLKLLGAKFTVKRVQQLRTYSTMPLLCILITTYPSIGKEIVDDVLKPPELEPMKDDPSHFSTFCHDRSDWVDYSMMEVVPFGMPSEKYNDRAE